MALRVFELPDLGEGLEEAGIVAWHVAPGERVVADQPLVSVETDKAVVEVPAPWSGVVGKLLAEPGETVRVGAPLVEFGDGARPDAGAIVGDLSGGAPASAPASAPAPAPDAPRPGGPVRAMPAARALAREKGLDLGAIRGTGPGGAIMRADVATAAPAAAPGPAPGWEALSGARRAMARRMEAAAAVPRATLHDLADVSHWMGPEADVLVRLIRACAAGAAAAPALNAWFDASGPSRRLHERLDLGIAVDTADGLYVPVLRDAGGRDAGGRDAGGRDAATIRAEADRLIRAARARELRPEDAEGATLTLSSYGALGGRHAELIVLPPSVAILGAGRAFPSYESGGNLTFLPLSLSFDHRAATGGEAAAFMAAARADLARPD